MHVGVAFTFPQFELVKWRDEKQEESTGWNEEMRK
jgi:hypothetical protein